MNHQLVVGNKAPDFEYPRQDGTLADFSELWARGPALVLWPRHAG